ncbi:putative Senescence-associated protein 21 [Hibiscus syriacus]|uniref:Putative Senescence-associated protein 21 n=1 Tax=Hibiscus syriacus TaxID=106335 RepID=A0A6A3BYB8_HIBSY|nr:FCS-Like Zinc finger 17-like [Hibiscus syriacus]KAE8719959.1 putative Senescence-associated protein 21 [Hibiscus syriacus]
MKLEQEHSTTEEETSNDTENPSKISSPVVVGLRILTDTSLGKSNVLVKPAFKISLPGSRNHRRRSRSPPADESFFLKSCQLCHKKLSLEKEVYMYRGDQGFCSIDCRERQIVLDEMRELELSAKTMLESPRHCSTVADTTDRQEIRRLIEDLRRRNKPPHQNQNHRAIAS